MLNLSDDDLKRIEEYASNLMQPHEIAILCGFNFRHFLQEYKSKGPVYFAYQRGFLATKHEIRKNIVKLAKMGSPLAEQLADKYISDLDPDDDE